MTPGTAVLLLKRAIAHGDACHAAALLDADTGLLDVRFADNVGLTPLMWAARNRHESIVADLLRRGADVSPKNRTEANGDGGNTALWFAAQGPEHGATGIVDRLVAAGADPDVRCESGQTALYVAAAWAHLDVVRRLIDHGADPAIADDACRTPVRNVEACVAWCDGRATLTADQRRFRDGAGRLIGFLSSLRPLRD